MATIIENCKIDDCRKRDLVWEIERLRAALAECAAEYRSPPCTVAEGAAYLSAEFQRRMDIAAHVLRAS